MAKMYIESDNSGRAVALNAGDDWYICDCAYTGCFVDVDIMNGTVQDAAHRIRTAIESGELYTADDYAECADDLSAWRPIPEWNGLTASGIMDSENAGRSCDFMTLTEI